jgi:hypothetical protein
MNDNTHVENQMSANHFTVALLIGGIIGGIALWHMQEERASTKVETISISACIEMVNKRSEDIGNCQIELAQCLTEQ